MSGDPRPTPRVPVPAPTTLPRLAAARYFASIGPYAVTYEAPCPHGVIVEWTATRDSGTASRALCGCNCEEAA